MKRMLQIEGVPVDREDWPKFTWNADLVDFEGPLVSLYRTDDDRDALYVWVDCSRATNRWCIVFVERISLLNYLTQKCTLRDVFDQVESVIVVNIGKTGRRTGAQFVLLDDLPEEYLPTRDSYLADELATDAARALVDEETQAYKVEINGDQDIYADDLTTIPKVFSQLYSFHYGLQYIDRPAVRSKLSDGMVAWRGGIDSVHLFTGLRTVIPSMHRARIASMEMHSPGFIEFDVLPSLLDGVRDAIVRISDREGFKRIEQLYKDINAYLRSEELSGFDGELQAKAKSLNRNQRGHLGQFVDEFMMALGWDSHIDTFNSLDADPLSKLRALLAYYRRLKQIRPLVQAGKVTFPPA